jgi:hypothetical protein
MADYLLAGPVLEHDGRDWRLDAAMDALVDGLRVRLAFEAGGDHVERGGDHAGHHAAAGKSADIVEADADAAFLRHRPEHHARDRGDLPLAVHFALHPLEQTLLLEGFEIRA